MKKLSLIIFFLSLNQVFGQKITWGVIAGFTKGYEFRKQNTKNNNMLFDPQKSTISNFTNCFGFYSSLRSKGGHTFELQLRKITIVRHGNQDSTGFVVLGASKGITHNLSTTLYYGFTKYNLSLSFGFYDSINLLRGIDNLDLYKLAYDLKYNKNTFGGSIKVGYQLSRLSLESCFDYPFTPSVESRAVLYYNPVLSMQLKYKLNPSEKFKQQLKMKIRRTI